MQSTRYAVMVLSMTWTSVFAEPPATPDTQVAQPSATSPAPASATSPSSSTAAIAAPAPVKVAADAQTDTTPEQIKSLRSAGYKPQTQNGRTLWCRSETPVGSHIEKKTCNSAQEIAKSTQDSQALVNQMQKSNSYSGK